MADQSISMTMAAPTTIPDSASDKSLKRKLEDALQSLDEAVGPSTITFTSPSRPPLKKLRTSRSIYAMLAKYGIKKDSKPATPSGDLDNLSKTAPHLAAILSRTASRTRNALPFRTGQSVKHTSSPVPSASDYRPSSTVSFLARLSTYKITTYGNKPSAINAVAASKCGWINEGKDRLVCGMCSVSWVVAGREGMTRDAANALVEKQRIQLVDAHKDGCPWKTRQCDDSIYRIPLQAPLSTIREIKTRAVLLDTVMRGVEIKHPLTSAQVQSLVSIISSVSLPSSSTLEEESATPSVQSVSSAVPLRAEASEIAILTALFGWSMLPPTADIAKPSSSVSRAGSVAPATPRRTPSRAPSVAFRERTPTPNSSFSSISMRISASTSLLSQHSVGSGHARPDTTLLHCPLCQRRIGLWAFLPQPAADEDAPMAGSSSTATDDNVNANSPVQAKKPQPQRQLDILREHRPYCPYVVRSTVLPSLPTQSRSGPRRSGSLSSVSGTSASINTNTSASTHPNAIEGWRAVMAIVSRYGNVQRQRLGLSRASTVRGGDAYGGAGEGDGVDGEENSIEAMVAGVKSHGGRDLLKYVKGLLA